MGICRSHYDIEIDTVLSLSTRYSNLDFLGLDIMVSGKIN